MTSILKKHILVVYSFRSMCEVQIIIMWLGHDLIKFLRINSEVYTASEFEGDLKEMIHVTCQKYLEMRFKNLSKIFYEFWSEGFGIFRKSWPPWSHTDSSKWVMIKWLHRSPDGQEFFCFFQLKRKCVHCKHRPMVGYRPNSVCMYLYSHKWKSSERFTHHWVWLFQWVHVFAS